MSRSRQILLVNLLEDDGPSEAGSPSVLNAVSLGRSSEVVSLMAQFNTSPDGAPETPGVLYGPGIIAQLPMVGPDDPVNQVVVTLADEDIAWPVLIRVCKALGWKMMDPDTGRTFG